MEKFFSLIFLFLAMCISLVQFFDRDNFGSKIMALVFFIFSLCAIIAIVKDIIRERKKSGAVIKTALLF